MHYLFMEAPLIRADVECSGPDSPASFSYSVVEKYNSVISLERHKEYFEAMAKHTHHGCKVHGITIRISQNDDYGKIVVDPQDKDGAPLWEVVYAG